MGTRGRGGVNSSGWGTRRWGSKGENIGHKGRNKIFLLWPSKGLFFFAKKLVSSKDEND